MHIHRDNLDQFWHRGIRVWLDGSEMDAGLITELSEEGGYLYFTITSKERAPLVDPDGFEIRIVRLTGRVDITLDGKDLSDDVKRACHELYRAKHAA